MKGFEMNTVWVVSVINLVSGKSDFVLFENKDDAIRHSSGMTRDGKYFCSTFEKTVHRKYPI